VQLRKILQIGLQQIGSQITDDFVHRVLFGMMHNGYAGHLPSCRERQLRRTLTAHASHRWRKHKANGVNAGRDRGGHAFGRGHATDLYPARHE
jgi:hypothetical protein